MTAKTVSHSFRSLLAAATILIATPSSAQITGSIDKGPSGLPLPRFVSIKAKKVNMRIGPGEQYAVAFRYMRSGVPIEIIQEFDNWRRVRDSDGTTGWIHGSLLSGNRTAVTSPWRKVIGSRDTVTLYSEPAGQARALAHIEPGVFGEIESCDGAWCEFTVDNGDRPLTGFVNQAELWGAYPDEVIR